MKLCSETMQVKVIVIVLTVVMAALVGDRILVVDFVGSFLWSYRLICSSRSASEEQSLACSWRCLVGLEIGGRGRSSHGGPRRPVRRRVRKS